MDYASGTQVSEDRSRAEIEKLLLRFGADEFGYQTKGGRAVIVFVYKSIPVRMGIDLPDRDDERFTMTPTGRKTRSEAQAFNEWQKECRRKWRALSLVIKGLLVGIKDGVIDFENAFMAHMVLPTGQTTGEALLPRVQKVIADGRVAAAKQLEVLD